MLGFLAGGLIGGAAAYLACRPRSRLERRSSEVIEDFHRLFYMRNLETWANAEWLGVKTLKCPLDAWVYQEVIHETRPDVLVETGTFDGGSAYFFASLFELMGRGRVVSVDIEDRAGRPAHPRIEYVRGGSTDSAVLDQVRSAINPGERVMAVLDSDHSRDHVLAELRAYWELVTPGCYLVVEDGNIHGNPVPIFDQGDPSAALETFLAENDRFQVDSSREKFLLTFNPAGWLRRIDDSESRNAHDQD